MIWPFQPTVPNDVLAIRTAPGRTNSRRLVLERLPGRREDSL